jgi:hemerythrin-like domain-containing protein
MTLKRDREPCEGCRQLAEKNGGALWISGAPPVGHPIDTLLREHGARLDMLEEIHAIVEASERAPVFFDPKVVERLDWLAEHIAEADSHHRREEAALFPELVRRGLEGPTRALSAEHPLLRALERSFADATGRLKESRSPAIHGEVRTTALSLVDALRGHIFRENYVLFPMALEVIDADAWTRIKAACDAIGYCCYTPEPAPIGRPPI